MVVPKLLYRNTELSYARAFVEEGEILFRPLSYYRRLEDPIRADPMEAKFTGSLTGAAISVDVHDDSNFVPFIKLDTGQITFESKHDDQIHVACFSLRPQPSFGRGVIEIFKPREFLELLSAAFADVNASLKYGSVSYYDDAAKFVGPPETEIWLMKRKQYESEAEFRISMFVDDRVEMYRRNFGKEPPVENGQIAPRIKVRVGSLSAFAKLA